MKIFPNYITHSVALVMEPARPQDIMQDCKRACWDGDVIRHGLRRVRWLLPARKGLGCCCFESSYVCFLFSFLPFAMACHFLPLSEFVP